MARTPNELKLFGIFGEDFTAPQIKAELAEMNSTLPLTVRIDSPGGSVAAGFAIASALEAYSGPVRFVIEAAALSIASYVVAKFDNVAITDNGFLMIHEPRVYGASGDSDYFDSQAKWLGDMRQTMAEAYARKMGTDVESVFSLMKKETFFSAEEAKANGLVSEIIGERVKSRAVAQYEIPQAVSQSLFGDDSCGESSTEEKTMSDEHQVVAASVNDIEKAFPKAEAQFVLDCVKAELNLEEVSRRHAVALEEKLESLQAENDELKGQVEALESAKEEPATPVEGEIGAVAQASAETETESATVRWNTAVAEYVKNGFEKPRAVSLANKNNPGLRLAMVAEKNA